MTTDSSAGVTQEAVEPVRILHGVYRRIHAVMHTQTLPVLHRSDYRTVSPSKIRMVPSIP